MGTERCCRLDSNALGICLKKGGMKYLDYRDIDPIVLNNTSFSIKRTSTRKCQIGRGGEEAGILWSES